VEAREEVDQEAYSLNSFIFILFNIYIIGILGSNSCGAGG